MTIRNQNCGTWVLGILVCLACLSGCRHADVTPAAEDGLLDLQQWRFEERGNIRLDGGWRFYWQQLVPPEQFTAKAVPAATDIIDVPDRWNGFQTGGEKIAGSGFATYHLRILLPPGDHRLGVKLLDMATAFTLYVNGEQAAAAGQPGISPDTSHPAYRPQVRDIGRHSGTLDIVVHVSNFHHWQGGFWEPVHLGRLRDIQWQREKKAAMEFFLLGCIVIMGIYHLGMFVIRTENKSVLYFALFNMLVALRTLTTGERYLLELAGELEFRTTLLIIYISFFLVVPVFTQYVRALFPEETSKTVSGAAWAISLIACVFVLAAPLPDLTRAMPLFQGLTLAIVAYGVWVGGSAVRSSRPGAKAFLAGFLIVAAAVVNDTLYTRQVIYTAHLVPWGFFLFIFSQALLLYQRFSGAFSTVEAQWRELAETNSAYQKELEQRIVAEKALKESETKYRRLIENSAEGICIVRRGIIVYANTRFLDMFEVSAGRLGDLGFLDLIHPADREKLTGLYQEWKRTGRSPGAFSIRGNDRETRTCHLEISVSAIQWEAMPSVMTLVRDVTEQVRTRELLYQSEKMLSVGGLAAGMAHEINNPLAGMMTNAQLIQRRLSTGIPANTEAADRIGISLDEMNRYARDRQIFRSLDHILSAGRNAAEIVNNMLSFARKSGSVKSPWPLEEIVDKALALASTDFTLKKQYDFKSIRIEREIQPGIAPVLCEESKIRQVLLNLIKNAAQAMNGQGADGRPPTIDIRIFQEDHLACLSVSDNGPGMPESVRKRVFEPFFTTKAKTQGTGLGLSISYYIITEDHGGQMDVFSVPGQGTVFTIRLPLAS